MRNAPETVRVGMVARLKDGASQPIVDLFTKLFGEHMTCLVVMVRELPREGGEIAWVAPPHISESEAEDFRRLCESDKKSEAVAAHPGILPFSIDLLRPVHN